LCYLRRARNWCFSLQRQRRRPDRYQGHRTVKVTSSFETGVPFFVWAEVPSWQQVPIPAGTRSFEELESFVPKAAAETGLDADKPLPFLVDGRERHIEFHIVNRIGDAPHNMEMYKKIQVAFELEKAEATIVGFHSTKHRGTFTPGDSNIHVHFQTPDNMKSGHIQKPLERAIPMSP
jgi:acetolactate decarboxylase